MQARPPASRRVELGDALDFINTLEHSRDGDTDHLSSLAIAIDWLETHGALDGPIAIADASDLSDIRAARAAMRDVADAVAHGRPADPDAVERVNALLANGDVPELRPSPDGVEIGARHAADPVADALGHLVEPFVEVIAEGAIDRLRVCANDSCRWVFYDTSRTARRRWCDMSTCGNRAKARRHRERRRHGDEGLEPTL